ncbi:helicase-associated domain-containing protein [Corynebacterium sp.]|uniref:helicase-associated domain-containing protein n=1 Tax=Corynebacterium sp. TaxID=1720 RepID=UPI0026DC776B|nr:helicase-associated domain-containing protein [Corynebacterium sp.]MDO5032727.1 helicase-associated domain-containing protein [Corynebacterium sp.]
MSSSSHSSSASSLYRAWLADLRDEELEILLRHRPDVMVPPPPSVAALANRLALRTSVARALARCNAQQLAALEEIAERGGELEAVSDTATEVTTQLRQRGLVFDTTAGGVMIAPDVLSALPTGWSLLHQDSVDAATLASLPGDQRSVLMTLARSGGVGHTREATADADPSRPIPQLIAAGLLERADAHTVRLPRAVFHALRGHSTRQIPTAPSGRAGTPQVSEKADDAGAAAGLGAVRDMEQLLSALGERPIELLKDKTVGVRPRAQLAKELAISEENLARLICLGLHARLLGRGEPSGLEGNFLAPTQAAQEWADAPLSERWRVLLEAYPTSPWAPWEEGRTLNADSHHERLPRFRATVLDVYRHSSVALNSTQFWEELSFRSPLFVTHTSATTIDALREEAEWLGLVATGQATSVLLDSASTAQLTPEQVSSFLIQADNTILVPGPLDSATHRTLTALADLESPGLASVYRISAQSLRRAMDYGLNAEEITAFLEEHCPSGIPQPVAYAIGDVAKQHGTLRSGPALAYLRSEDPALIELALHAVPELRRLAPTVAMSSLRVGELLSALRAHGLSPAAEDDTGALLAVAPEPYALPTPSPAKPAPASPEPSAVVAALRRGSGESAVGAGAAEGAGLETLQAAARSQRRVTIIYADKNGNAKEITVVRDHRGAGLRQRRAGRRHGWRRLSATLPHAPHSIGAPGAVVPAPVPRSRTNSSKTNSSSEY